jgi:hypothetical protein
MVLYKVTVFLSSRIFNVAARANKTIKTIGPKQIFRTIKTIGSKQIFRK